jgi:hypothetical protein
MKPIHRFATPRLRRSTVLRKRGLPMSFLHHFSTRLAGSALCLVLFSAGYAEAAGVWAISGGSDANDAWIGRSLVGTSGSVVLTASNSSANAAGFLIGSLAGGVTVNPSSGTANGHGTVSITASINSSSLGNQIGSFALSDTAGGTGVPLYDVGADFVANRMVTASTAAFGRMLINTTTSGTTTINTNDPGNADRTDTSNTRVSYTSRGTTLNLTGGTTGGVLPVSYTAGNSTGAMSGTITITPTSLESGIGGVNVNTSAASVPYSATVLAPRVLAATTTEVDAALGNVLVRAYINVSVNLTSTGDDKNATRLNVSGGNLGSNIWASGAYVNGSSVPMCLSGVLTSYNGTASGSTALGVTSAEKNDPGGYANAHVGFSANVGEGVAAGTTYTGGTTLRANVDACGGAHDSLAGLSSRVTKANNSAFNGMIPDEDVRGTEARILDGWNTAEQGITVSMVWRNPSAADQATSPRPIISDIVDLEGVLPGTEFVLQMNYDPTTVGSAENEMLMYNAGTISSPNWLNAVAGNTTGTPTFFNESWAAAGSPMAVGDYGVDTSTHTAWAVLNHNSEFGVAAEPLAGAPEPSTCALFGVASLVLAGFAWQRQKHSLRRKAA